MSFTEKDASVELHNIIDRAVTHDDDETLYKYAEYYADVDPELADQLKRLAKRAEDNNWAHDRNNNN